MGRAVFDSEWAREAGAPGAALPLPFLPGKDGGVGGEGVAAGPVELVAADVAVEVAVRPDGRDVDTAERRRQEVRQDRRLPDVPGALLTRHAFLVVEPALYFHLLRGVNCSCTAGTGHGVIVGRYLNSS